MDDDMPYPEFCRLLTGITYKTPLGEIIQIRSEEDKEMLKHYTTQQHKIRNDWRNKQMVSEFESMSDEDKRKAAQEAQQIFANMFGSKARTR